MISSKAALLFLATATLACAASASTWTGSGSDGSDGDFILTATDSRIVNGIFTFDPVRDNLDRNATNVYNFNAVTIPYNVTVVVRANKLRQPGPMIWLARGAVIIAGILDLNGNNGHDSTVSLSVRSPSQPGPGGFPGGAGAKPGDVPQRGFGPGGGVAPAGVGSSGCSAGFAATYTPSANPSVSYGAIARCAGGSVAYGNGNLQPFLGGSGGSGGYPNAATTSTGPGGGAGGGAIRISSDVSITVSRAAFGCCGNAARITANGGNGGAYSSGGNSTSTFIIGGGGSGGAIHLQAPLVNLGADANDTLTAIGGFGTAYAGDAGNSDRGSAGRIRVDTDNLQGGAIITPTPLVNPLVNVPLPTNMPAVTVVSINGTPVPSSPNNSYSAPDLSINNTGNIPVVITTRNIPNTTISLHVTTEAGTADSVTPVTLTNGTGTGNITLPPGVSRFVIRATW